MTTRNCPFCHAVSALVVSHGPKNYYCFSCGALGRIRYEVETSPGYEVHEPEQPQIHILPSINDNRPTIGRHEHPYQMIPRAYDD